MEGHHSVEAAVKAYVREVKSGKFPGAEHGFAG
jgi:3-methyl-2-oxobutanoate hydroxymethyltransferase